MSGLPKDGALPRERSLKRGSTVSTVLPISMIRSIPTVLYSPMSYPMVPYHTWAILAWHNNSIRSDLTLSLPIMCYPALFFPILLCHTLPYPTLYCPILALSIHILPYHGILYNYDLACHGFPILYSALFWSILVYYILSYPVLSIPILPLICTNQSSILGAGGGGNWLLHIILS